MMYKNIDMGSGFFSDEDEVGGELGYDTVPSDDEFAEYVNYILGENDRIASGLFEQD